MNYKELALKIYRLIVIDFNQSGESKDTQNQALILLTKYLEHQLFFK